MDHEPEDDDVTSPAQERDAVLSAHDLPVLRPGRHLVTEASRILTAPGWVARVAVAATLVIAWLLNYASGGTKTATPHLFYIPIILAAIPFGLTGAAVTAIIGAAFCGLVPIDVATGERQPASTVLLRAVMFLVVAGATSGALALRRQLDGDEHYRELSQLIGRPSPGVSSDPALASLVAGVLANRSFHAVFQPVYSLHTGALMSIEALTRFDVEPYRPPDHWFAAAAAAGLGADLEIAALECAVEAAAGTAEDVPLSVNASPATLADPRLHQLLSSAGRLFTVEITEHAVVSDYRLLTEPLQALRDAGVLIAVDDAGAGFASLQHIVEIFPDVIKLDISLTQEVATSPVRQALGGALIDFVHRTGALLVVEGVETVEDLAAWSTMGADAVQGYVVGRPGALPVAAVSPTVVTNLARRLDPSYGHDLLGREGVS
ncbi:MAG TPA: EAL domain-containing protein [Actinotalea sp.]